MSVAELGMRVRELEWGDTLDLYNTRIQIGLSPTTTSRDVFRFFFLSTMVGMVDVRQEIKESTQRSSFESVSVETACLGS